METDKNKNDRNICRAIIEPATEDGYDFQAVAVPAENKQLRFSYQNNEYFYQVLRTGKENIKTERLESGLPLFDNHPLDNAVMNQLGITVGYEFTEAGIVVRAKFGARADEPLKSDVKNSIVKTVSIEGDIEQYTIERTAGEIPIYYADIWEPTSLSFAPVPQDIGAQIEVKRAIQKQIDLSTISNNSIIKSLINKF